MYGSLCVCRVKREIIWTDMMKKYCVAFPVTWVHEMGSEETFVFFYSHPGQLRKGHT